jgi:hypothetical protein
MKLFHTVRSLFLWVVELVLIVIWFSTIGHHLGDGDIKQFLLAVLVVVLLFILYFAEGIELAVADLLDKQPDQLGDESLRSLLEEIQQERGFFFSNRQVFVVAIIALMTLITSYPWLYVPFVGKVKELELPFWFSLFFTTLTVLWFCQVTPKRLAVINSERFLRQSRFIWPLIKLVGRLGLPSPSDDLVRLLEARSTYRHKRHLLPSRELHYNTTAKLYGFALDRLRVHLTLRADGGARIVRRFLVLFVHGEHTQIHGHLEAPSRFAARPAVTVLGLYACTLPEQISAIAGQLDAAFEDPDKAGALGPNLMGDWAFELHVETESGAAQGETATWVLHSLRPLPDGVLKARPRAGERESSIAVLLYEVAAEVAAGAYLVPGTDHWDEHAQFPCRHLTVALDCEAAADFDVVVTHQDVALHDFSTPLPEEAERCRRSAPVTGAIGRSAIDIAYPLPGGIYRIHWEAMRAHGRAQGSD